MLSNMLSLHWEAGHSTNKLCIKIQTVRSCELVPLHFIMFMCAFHIGYLREASDKHVSSKNNCSRVEWRKPYSLEGIPILGYLVLN